MCNKGLNRVYAVQKLKQTFSLQKALGPHKQDEIAIILVGQFSELVDPKPRINCRLFQCQKGLFTDADFFSHNDPPLATHNALVFWAGYAPLK